ncbi:A-kinase anchor protein 12b isoform X2 [Erpetoichthys calabaricus]|uniref:A-kinase anchoring protein 12 n=1 Tax=Erpetoichthys calabaricus TaxID=27687 RepID=A0A8C4RKA1_ERPCA|nr:A-kinase anchor protein 12b isoform X2 [Erpetoichthys calabaricus]
MLGTITLTVGQGDPAAVAQKEEAVEKMETVQEEDTPHINGEKLIEDASPSASEGSPVDEKLGEEEKAAEQQTTEVGFKKVFKFVGFKFTLKKDKNEKPDPVQLLTVKKEDEDASSSEAEKESKSEAPVAEPEKTEKPSTILEEDLEETKTEIDTTTEVLAEKVNGEASESPVEVVDSPEISKEPEKPDESPTSPVLQETQSPLKRFFTQGLFSTLRKRTSFKKSKEEDQPVKLEEEKKENDEKKSPVVECESPEETSGEKLSEQVQDTEASVEGDVKEIGEVISDEPKVVVPEHQILEDNADLKVALEVEVKIEDPSADSGESTVDHVVEVKTEEEAKTEVEASESEGEKTVKEEIQSEKPMDKTEPEPELTQDALDENLILEESGVEDSTEIKQQVVTAEHNLLNSQEKAKLQGSPLKKLFTGTGLKKLSGKKQKTKKEEEGKVAHSSENGFDQLQSSSESAEGQKVDSLPSSPEECTEQVVAETVITEMTGPEGDGEGATSDGERKKDGITPWASFKKLVTPKKRVKRPSESDKEDEPNEKVKGATLSSTDSSASAEKHEEPKASEEEQKLERSTEEPKKKVDTSVSWEALICVGSSKKRGRKTSDSDEESPKVAEETQNTEESVKGKDTIAESPITSSHEADNEAGGSSPEQGGSPSDGEGVSTWESFKRLVTPRRKAKLEDKLEDSAVNSTHEQIPSDSEIAKEESSFSLKKLIPGRRKKKSDGKPEPGLGEDAHKIPGESENGEDSDTPAVVPLSEYDATETEQVELVKDTTMKEVKHETDLVNDVVIQQVQEAAVEMEPKVIVEKASEITAIDGDTTELPERNILDVDERSPSWISAKVMELVVDQKAENLSRRQQLSDIAEEESAVITKTPVEMSKQNNQEDTIAEDIVELTSEAVTALDQAPEEIIAEETEMVSAVSQLSESSATSGNVTPVPEINVCEVKQTDEVLQEAAEKMKLTSVVLSATETAPLEETAVVVTSTQLVESAVESDTTQELMHREAKAVSWSTDLSTEDLEVSETRLAKTTVEVITVVMEAVSSELAAEERIETEVVDKSIQTTEISEILMGMQGKTEDKPNICELNEEVIETFEPTVKDDVIAEILHAPVMEERTEAQSTVKKEEFVQSLKCLSEETPTLLKPEEMSEEKKDEGISEKILEEEVVQKSEFIEVQTESVVSLGEVITDTPNVEEEGPAVSAVEDVVCTHHITVSETSPTEERVQELVEVKEVADTCQAPVEEITQSVPQEEITLINEVEVLESLETQETVFPVTVAEVEEQVVKETANEIEPLLETLQSEVIAITAEEVVSTALVNAYAEQMKHEVVPPCKDEHEVSETTAVVVGPELEAATGIVLEEVVQKEMGEDVVIMTYTAPVCSKEILDEKQEDIEAATVSTAPTELQECNIQTLAIEKQSKIIAENIIQNVVESFTERVTECHEKKDCTESEAKPELEGTEVIPTDGPEQVTESMDDLVVIKLGSDVHQEEPVQVKSKSEEPFVIVKPTDESVLEEEIHVTTENQETLIEMAEHRHLTSPEDTIKESEPDAAGISSKIKDDVEVKVQEDVEVDPSRKVIQEADESCSQNAEADTVCQEGQVEELIGETKDIKIVQLEDSETQGAMEQEESKEFITEPESYSGDQEQVHDDIDDSLVHLSEEVQPQEMHKPEMDVCHRAVEMNEEVKGIPVENQEEVQCERLVEEGKKGEEVVSQSTSHDEISDDVQSQHETITEIESEVKFTPAETVALLDTVDKEIISKDAESQELMVQEGESEPYAEEIVNDKAKEKEDIERLEHQVEGDQEPETVECVAADKPHVDAQEKDSHELTLKNEIEKNTSVDVLKSKILASEGLSELKEKDQQLSTDPEKTCSDDVHDVAESQTTAGTEKNQMEMKEENEREQTSKAKGVLIQTQEAESTQSNETLPQVTVGKESEVERIQEAEEEEEKDLAKSEPSSDAVAEHRCQNAVQQIVTS